ncbi:hypothetical protein WA158_003846 [Blastocystis sp. Blastoise]
MQYNAGSGISGLLKDGYRHLSGLEEAVLKNIDACCELAAIHRTSLGPNGMLKLVINNVDKLFVTSDTATIVQEMEVMHPAANMVVQAAQMQEKEIGDGTNFVVTFAGELLKKAADLIDMGVHVSDIIAGYEKSIQKTLDYLDTLIVDKVEDVRDKDRIKSILNSIIASKQYGHESVLSSVISEACVNALPKSPAKADLDVDNVRVVKLNGSSVDNTSCIQGMILRNGVVGSVRHIKQAKICVLACGLEASSSETKGTVLIHNADELVNFSKNEEQDFGDEIESIAKQGINVIIAGGQISEMARHFLNKYGILGISLGSKFDLRRLCRSIGAVALVRVGPPVPEEIGTCAAVDCIEIGGKTVVQFKQDQEQGVISTIIVRGSTDNILDDVERCINNSVNTMKTLCKDGRLLAGAGASDMNLAVYLSQFGEECPGLDQYAVKKFAEALEVVPRILAENSGKDATNIITLLYKEHTKNPKSTIGVDIEGEDICDALTGGEYPIYDLYATKKNALRLAADVAITILRVDQIIMAKEAGGPKFRGPQGDVDPDM